MTKEEIEAFAERLRSISREIDALPSIEDRAALAQMMTDALGVASIRVAVSRQDAVRALRDQLGWSHLEVGRFLSRFRLPGKNEIGKGMAARIAHAKLNREDHGGQ